jgi:hypothetical protein
MAKIKQISVEKLVGKRKREILLIISASPITQVGHVLFIRQERDV